MWNIAISKIKGKLFKNSNILWCQNDILQYWSLYLLRVFENRVFFFLLALQTPLGVVFYSPLPGVTLLAYEVS